MECKIIRRCQVLVVELDFYGERKPILLGYLHHKCHQAFHVEESGGDDYKCKAVN